MTDRPWVLLTAASLTAAVCAIILFRRPADWIDWAGAISFSLLTVSFSYRAIRAPRKTHA